MQISGVLVVGLGWVGGWGLPTAIQFNKVLNFLNQFLILGGIKGDGGLDHWLWFTHQNQVALCFQASLSRMWIGMQPPFQRV